MLISDEAESLNEPIVQVVKKAVLRSIEREGLITPAVEAKVHRAVDLLHLARADEAPLRTVESISCTLHEMRQWLIEGRVNAYASGLLRLRRTVEAL